MTRHIHVPGTVTENAKASLVKAMHNLEVEIMINTEDQKAADIVREVSAMLSEWEQSGEGTREFSERLIAFIKQNSKEVMT